MDRKRRRAVRWNLTVEMAVAIASIRPLLPGLPSARELAGEVEASGRDGFSQQCDDVSRAGAPYRRRPACLLATPATPGLSLAPRHVSPPQQRLTPPHPGPGARSSCRFTSRPIKEPARISNTPRQPAAVQALTGFLPARVDHALDPLSSWQRSVGPQESLSTTLPRSVCQLQNRLCRLSYRFTRARKGSFCSSPNA